MQFTHSLKAPGFNPFEPEKWEKNWFHAFAFKFNLYRYTWAAAADSLLGVAQVTGAGTRAAELRRRRCLVDGRGIQSSTRYKPYLSGFISYYH
jgi:hypothetical protein